MPNTQNIKKVKDISQKVEKATSITFFEYKNLGSNAVNDLRRKVEQVSAEILVAKNTLVKIALGTKKAEDADLKGQTGVVFSFGDSVVPLKALADFAKKFEAVKIKGAFIDGIYYNSQKVAQISQLPSKLELIAKMLAGFKNPLAGFAVVLRGISDAKAKEVDK
ncbi:50S ribosomal protein L10 [candidate division WWE3 bacterium CG08_land_8_20_14_0_20_41_10]|uniref:Large ribosomal subunit protein uL10 n=1 Tax=candidate division WWE3 bacterium CG08_land_8_20_14_0_20_41_10 TaxID=1975085 RepID=A0A2H0XC78_UNCKA|nr:MAG: 50S ribosomal protein L10 [candidate division WWE3 bacterium CG08_land_8_20_14_0_20_41_10]